MFTFTSGGFTSRLETPSSEMSSSAPAVTTPRWIPAQVEYQQRSHLQSLISGEKHTGGEPLKTLRSFRSSLDEVERKEYGTSPFFGVNLGVETGGEISVGDTVWISSRLAI